jgi:hypothetical protein
MKKIIFAALVLCSSFAVQAAEEPIVNEKVLNAFNKTFAQARNISWSEAEHSYEVKFMQNETSSRITYDKEGNIIKTFRYYKDEDQLPIMVLARLKNRFTDKKVYGVVEVSSDEGTFYHITLEDAKNWVEVKADTYGELVVQKKFRKA